MLYASLIFWLLVIVFSAWGVHSLWSRLIKPRAVNTVLLPGTLVAQLGHVLGLLVTGNAVRNTALMGDDEKGDPQSEEPDKQRLPVIGSLVVGLLPLLACAGALYATAAFWGRSVIDGISGAETAVAQELPHTLGGLWELLRNSISLMETIVNAIIHSDLPNWPTVLFLYLAVCLTVRMTPFEGNRRGALGAIMLSGVVIWIVASMASPVEGFVRTSWPLLSFTVGMLLFLLMLSLLVTGIVGLVKILARNE